MSPDYWTTAEVAAHYRVSPDPVRYWRHKGYGPKGVKVGKHVLYRRPKSDRFDRELLAGEAERVSGRRR